MNCRQGDLAVVVKSLARGENLGRIVRIKSYVGRAGFINGMEYDHCWLVEGRLTRRDHAAERLGADACIPDECLRPIRDPGEDVPDESTAWLPSVPLHDEVTA